MKLLFALLFVSTSLIAEDFAYDPATGKAMPKFIGEIKLVKGNVFREVQGQRAGVKEGSQLYPGDTLITEEKSFVRALMVDQTTVSLGPNSNLNFESFKYKSNTDRQAVYHLVQGQLRSAIKNKAKDGDLRFRAKDALMGIRGTEILMNRHSVGKVEISEFALLSGEAEVKEAQGRKHELDKNDRLILIHGEKPRHEKNLLERDELELMEDDETFLPLAALDSVTGEASDSAKDNITGETYDSSSRKGTLENLELLNEQLRQNQNRTR